MASTSTAKTNSPRRNRIALAAVQDSPVAFDLRSSIEKLQTLTAQAAKQARSEAAKGGEERGGGDGDVDVVVVFPEAFLSCYPRGYGFGATVGSRTAEGRSWFRRYHESSVPVCNVEGEEMTAIRRAASENNVTLVVGVIERCDEPVSGPARHTYGSSNPGGSATLYCTALTISTKGELLAAHRKLMPTGSERLVWGQGDGAGVRVVESPAGKIGSVICWENYMPLMRMAMYAKGVEIYCAPTADTRDAWTSTMRHIGLEGRCFVISCCQFNLRSDFPSDYPGFEGNDKESSKTDNSIVTRGGSVIIGPLGETLAGPLYDQSGILTAIVDRKQLLESRMDFDPCGHYSRPDVFSLSVDARSKSASTFDETSSGDL